ncbi:MAG: hypothetical protein IPK80_28760 [Nannocystis sp.]|nr:hypothetical protein [Nannocystis sp.]
MALIYETGERGTTLYSGKKIYFHSRLLQGPTVETPISEDKDRATSPNPFGAFEKLCQTGCVYGGPTAPYNPYTKTPDDNEDYRGYGPLKRALAGKTASFLQLSLGGPSLQQRDYPSDERTHFYPKGKGTPPLAEVAEATPWTRPQPQTPICPFCPVTGTTLSISLRKDLFKGKPDDAVVQLKSPVLEFNLGDEHGFVAVSLGDLLVASRGLKIPLDRYKIAVGGVTKGLGEAIVESKVGAGSLTIFLMDSATGEPRANISLVQVLPEI